MIDEKSMVWFALRDRRASLAAYSKLGDSSARRQTFAAAMAQFEEQMTAAKVVSPATRPLNLYYGLAQAGMAIAAAHSPDPWSFSSHGLKLLDSAPDLAEIQVTTEGNGAFQKVAASTGSPGINNPVSLGALWASIPDLAATATLPGPATPTPIVLFANDSYTNAPQARVYLPHEMPENSDEWRQRFTEILASYPAAAGWKIPLQVGSIQPPPKPGDKWSVLVEWPSPSPMQEMSVEQINSFFDGVAPEYYYRNNRFLRPSVADDEPPSSLMTWWLLLFSFSILARYQPRKWVGLLDLDKSQSAVPLQYALEQALSVVPPLVLGALDKKPWLLSKPLSLG